jgi:N-acetylglucosaminyl-diphospho-decaprenol L-rhamnosyltransferase
VTAATGSAELDVAVVIVNHNTRDLLLACVASLYGGGLEGLRARVFVVDNASTDGSPEAVAAGAAKYPAGFVQLLENRENVGYAAANNRALRLAGFGEATDAAPADADGPSFRLALLLNPDTLVPPCALARLAGFLDADSGLAAVGPKLVLPDGSLDLACRRSFPTPEVSLYRFTGLARLFPQSPRFGRYNLTYLDPDAPADVDSVVGACMLVRGAAIRRVGLLDETFWMYGEDLDWALRMHQAGWRVGYRPQVVVHHVKRGASRGNERARYEFQRAMWLFYRKHYQDRTSRPTHVLVLLALALRGGPRLTREMMAAGTPRVRGAAAW